MTTIFPRVVQFTTIVIIAKPSEWHENGPRVKRKQEKWWMYKAKGEKGPTNKHKMQQE